MGITVDIAIGYSNWMEIWLGSKVSLGM